MKQTVNFEVELDANNLPINIKMQAKPKTTNLDNLKALMISAWDGKGKETLRIDLWTKDMMVSDMFIMYHQTMIGMASSLEKSTGHNKLADALRDYCSFFAEQTKIFKQR